MKQYSDKQLADVFSLAEKTIYDHSENKSRLSSALKPFKGIKVVSRKDSEYFQIMVRVVFYSGFKATTVTKKLNAIHHQFRSIETVSKLKSRDVQRIIKSGKVIGNEKKINGVIRNAQQFLRIRSEFGSFDKYLSSFGDYRIGSTVDNMAKDLIKRFAFIGKITVYHFLTDLGYQVLKPDRVLSRIFARLKLVKNSKEFTGVVDAGRKIASAAKVPIRYVDMIFVNIGQVGEKPEFGLKYGICLEKKPLCSECSLISYCSYPSKRR